MPLEPPQGWPDGEDAGDDDWHDDVIWPAATGPGIPWAGAVGPPHAGRQGRPGRPRGPLASLIVVAVLAAGAGAGLTIALTGQSGTPAAATSTPGPGRTSGQVPGGASGGVPGGAPGGGQAGQMLVIGTVTAVSPTSITIGGAGPSVIAAVTGSTRVTGRVHSISGIKVGDQVSAQLTQSGGRVTAVAIQYPAQQPGGGLP